MTMNPLYPCGKPYSTGPHNGTVCEKSDPISAFISRFMMESRPLISSHGLESRMSECYQLLNRIESSVIFSVTIVIHKSRNVIGIARKLRAWA